MDAASIISPSSLEDPRTHLRAEMARVADLLGRLLQRLRERGRSPAGEVLQGFMIEDGEAEGIALDLSRRWSCETFGSAAGHARPPMVRGGIAEFDANCQEGRVFLPLRHAARNFELMPVEYLSMLLALAVEVDGLFGRLVAYLNDHVGRSRPTIGLALNLGAAMPDGTDLSPLAFCDRPAVRDGLLELEGDGPAPGLSLRVPRDMALRLVADAAPDTLPLGFRHFASEPGLLARLVLDDDVRRRLLAWAQSLRNQSRTGPLILAGSTGAGRTTAARGAIGELDLPLLVAEVSSVPFGDRLRAARREACWHGAPLLVRIATSVAPAQADWSAFWAGLADLHLPLLIAATPETAVALSAAAATEPAVITIPELPFAARAALWRTILPPSMALVSDAAEQLATRFRFNPGRIHRAVQRASVGATLGPADAGGLAEGCLQGLGQNGKGCRSRS
jgi:hypothetical protein